MLRSLRELALLTLLAMGGMTLMVAAGTVRLAVPGGMQFHFASAKLVRVASNDPALRLAVNAPAQPPLVPLDPGLANAGNALDRLHLNVSGELYPWFDVVLYVSKAAEGPLAQRMYIFHKDAGGALEFEQTFLVSTGRERHEKYFTSTPAGLFELDPNRFERYHYSRTWHAGMPWAMFLNATIGGRQTGIALHSAGAHVPDLGSRASGGCVRLPPEKAAELFDRFQREERGFVPIFAFDASLNRTSPTGRIVRDPQGRPVMYYGYRVLLVIEDYAGGPALVATLA